MKSVGQSFTDLLTRSCGLQCGSDETYVPSSPLRVRHGTNTNHENETSPDVLSEQHRNNTGKNNRHQLQQKSLHDNNISMSLHDRAVIGDTNVNSADEFEEAGKELLTVHVSSSSTVGTDHSIADSDSFADIALPTLPFYSVAESRNKNCWSQPSVSIFQVRGPNYFSDKKKITSNAYLFQARGSDLYLADSTANISMSKMNRVVLGGELRKKPTLAVIFSFPWGFMNLYYEVPAHLAKYMGGDDIPLDFDFSPSERAVARWLMAGAEYRNSRLKLVPLVAEGPWAARNLVTGRPALIGKKLPVSYELFSQNNETGEAPLLTVTLDIGNSSATAKRIVSICRRYMGSLTLDVGFVIQSETQDELPEVMLGAIRVHGPDPLKAPKINSK